jgi:predicted transposase/invertase (TIGR01784 family)
MKVHDSGYKKLFSNKTIFRQLMESFVREEWVQEIDFTTSETLDKSFVSSHYKETESDLIYKVKFRGQDLYLYILMEFQSTVDHFMALRFINYITNSYMDYVNNNKGINKLPPIFPILLYNGEEEWTAPVTLSELVEGSELSGDFETRLSILKS